MAGRGTVAAERPAVAAALSQGWFITRLVLLALVASVGLGMLILGRGPGQLDDLTDALSAGRLHAVTVLGRGLPAEATGCTSQQIVWREHLVAREVTVGLQVGDELGCTSVGTDLAPGVRDAATFVRRLDPDVVVRRAPAPTSSFSIASWEGPAPLVLLAVLAAGVQLAVIISGPEPRRATRWAWFWLSGSGVGVLALAVLSGPFPGVPAPRRPDRRLTGGWAFLLGIVLSSAGSAWVLGWT